MITDVFTFNDEIEMLQFRMAILGPVVDEFIAVEGNITHQGNPKPWNCPDLPKLKSFQVTIPFSTNLIENEFYQQDEAQKSCNHLKDEDIIIFGAVDEIPTRESVQRVRDNPAMLPRMTEMMLFMPNLNRLQNIMWGGSVFCNAATFRELKGSGVHRLIGQIDNVRGEPRRANKPWDGPFKCDGWHLSYMGGNDAIRRKLKSFIHSNYNCHPFTSDDHLNAASKSGKLFHSQLDVTHVDRNIFPDYFLEHAPAHWFL